MNPHVFFAKFIFSFLKNEISINHKNRKIENEYSPNLQITFKSFSLDTVLFGFVVLGVEPLVSLTLRCTLALDIGFKVLFTLKMCTVMCHMLMFSH